MPLLRKAHSNALSHEITIGFSGPKDAKVSLSNRLSRSGMISLEGLAWIFMLRQIVERLSGKGPAPRPTAEDYQLLRSLTAKDEIDEKLAYAAMFLELALIDGHLDKAEEVLIARSIKASRCAKWQSPAATGRRRAAMIASSRA